MPFHAGTLRLADDAPQMVFQDAGASLTPWLTVGELLEDRLRSMKLSRDQRRERVAHALESVGLPTQVLAVRPAQLSGGQRQRVALARAVVVPPAVLLCDEPTSALDVSVAANVLNLIGRLRRDLGMAVVFVTHDLAIARLIADRIAVMYLGRIVECGPAEQVIAAPAHPYTGALIASLPGPERDDDQTCRGAPEPLRAAFGLSLPSTVSCRRSTVAPSASPTSSTSTKRLSTAWTASLPPKTEWRRSSRSFVAEQSFVLVRAPVCCVAFAGLIAWRSPHWCSSR